MSAPAAASIRITATFPRRPADRKGVIPSESPHSTPIVGATPYANLFLNTGHGTLGWTMACGSAKVVADQVMGRRPDIRTDGLAMDRYLSPAPRRPVSALPSGASA